MFYVVELFPLENDDWYIPPGHTIVADDLARSYGDDAKVFIGSFYNILASAPGGLTHWSLDIMDAIMQMTFSSSFSWIEISKFQLNFTEVGS